MAFGPRAERMPFRWCADGGPRPIICLFPGPIVRELFQPRGCKRGLKTNRNITDSSGPFVHG